MTAPQPQRLPTMQSNTPADALRGLIKSAANDCVSNDEIAEMTADFCRDHAPALLDRLDRQDQRIAELEKVSKIAGEMLVELKKNCVHLSPTNKRIMVQQINKVRAALTDGGQP